MISFADIVGYAAGILVAVTMIPQLVLSLKTKNVQSLSKSMIVIFFFQAFLFVIYGILITAWPLIITDTLAVIVAAFQFYIKLKYEKH